MRIGYNFLCSYGGMCVGGLLRSVGRMVRGRQWLWVEVWGMIRICKWWWLLFILMVLVGMVVFVVLVEGSVVMFFIYTLF